MSVLVEKSHSRYSSSQMPELEINDTFRELQSELPDNAYRASTNADICMCVDVLINAEGMNRLKRYKFYAELFYKMESGIPYKIGAIRPYVSGWLAKYSDNSWLLSDYLQGGNHAQFGNYGAQDGDGTSEIATESQWSETVEAIVAFVQ